MGSAGGAGSGSGAGSGFGRCLSKGRSPTQARRNPQSGSISSLAGIVRSLATSRAPSPSRYPPAARIAATRRSACSLLLRFRLCLASCAAVGVSSPNAGTIGEVGASTHIDLFPRSLSVSLLPVPTIGARKAPQLFHAGSGFSALRRPAHSLFRSPQPNIRLVPLPRTIARRSLGSQPKSAAGEFPARAGPYSMLQPPFRISRAGQRRAQPSPRLASRAQRRGRRRLAGIGKTQSSNNPASRAALSGSRPAFTRLAKLRARPLMSDANSASKYRTIGLSNLAESSASASRATGARVECSSWRQPSRLAVPSAPGRTRAGGIPQAASSR